MAGLAEYTEGANPILKMDYPDPDVICVNDTFYMISTTMHYMPGAEILKSYDLINWEHAAFVYDRLDGTDARRLTGDKHIYGKGMWAATLRYHEGLFYVIFVCNDTQKTYLYRSESIEGTWVKSTIDGFYHDCSPLFDDGKAYLVYGNTEIYLTELNADMSGPKEGGINRCILKDAGNKILGYEGSHIYKIDGRYYLFLIHSKPDRWRRVEACFTADSLLGDFVGGDVFDDDLGFRNSGIAQGGIVEGPKGVWNAVLFQDRGAVGRIPVLVPLKYEDEADHTCRFSFGINGKAPSDLRTISLKPGYIYKPLVCSDDFKYDPVRMYAENRTDHGCFGFKSIWQFNHEPDLKLLECDQSKGVLWIKTDKTVRNIYHAKNILTQRMIFPGCSAEVTIDGSMLNDGDLAGLAAFQGDYALVGLRKENGRLHAVMSSYTNPYEDVWKLGDEEGITEESTVLDDDRLIVRLTVDFGSRNADIDTAVCEVCIDGKFRKIGTEHKLRFRLDHFTGCRFGLFVMSGSKTGGKAGFSEFEYLKL
ncbi:MAG: glycoside hydrolase 43 family protein [Lachnospiraceae bacterium]|nr:glycoside hydrolase 43 family protein [Lachnospiraceae bacterium]